MSRLPVGIAGVAVTEIDDTSSTTRTINLPALKAGDMGVIALRLSPTSTVNTHPFDLTPVSRSDTGVTHIYTWMATGAEGATVDLVTASAVRLSAIALRVINPDPYTVPEVVFAGSNTNEMPSIAPSWGSERNLYIAVMTNRRSDSSVSAGPTNYGSNFTTIAQPSNTGTTRVRVSVASRTNTSSSEDPGGFSTSGTIDNPHSAMIAIRSRNSINRIENLRVSIEDAEEAMQDMADVGGVDWLESVTISANLDQMCARASVNLFREAMGISGPLSMAPLMTDQIAAGRMVLIEAFVEDIGGSSGSWVKVFQGFVDDAAWGGDESRISIPCRDMAAPLHDMWIEAPAEYGGEAEEIEDVMQEILDDRLDALAPTIVTVGDPGLLPAYQQERESLATALNSIVNSIGWDFRYRLVSGDFALVLREPDDTQTTPDFTFTPDEYYTISEVALLTGQIRNVVVVQFTDTEGVEDTAEVEDSASIASLANSSDDGRRLLPIDVRHNPLIPGATAANYLAEAALRDLSQPPLTHTAEQPLFPEVQLGQLIRYAANGIHYDTDQDVAVVAYQHAFSREAVTTTVWGRGKPSGGSVRWVQIGSDSVRRIRDAAASPVPPPPLVARLQVWINDVGEAAPYATGNDAIASWRIAVSTVEAPDIDDVLAASPVNGQSVGLLQTGVMETAEAGETVYMSAVAFSLADGVAGQMSELITASARFGIGSSDQVGTGAIIADNLRKGAQQVVSGIQFFPTDHNTVQWDSAAIRFADGTSVTVNSGNTGNMTAGQPNYIYYNGTTTLQVTTTFANVVGGEDNVLLCVARGNASSDDGPAFFVPSHGSEALGLTITAAEINVVKLSALTSIMGEVFSANYDAGVDGFALFEDGSAEFNDITIRGTLDGVAGTFAGDLTATTTMARELYAQVSGIPNIFGRSEINLALSGSLGTVPTIAFNKANNATSPNHDTITSSAEIVLRSDGTLAVVHAAPSCSNLSELLAALDDLGWISDTS